MRGITSLLRPDACVVHTGSISAAVLQRGFASQPFLSTLSYVLKKYNVSFNLIIHLIYIYFRPEKFKKITNNNKNLTQSASFETDTGSVLNNSILFMIVT